MSHSSEQSGLKESLLVELVESGDAVAACESIATTTRDTQQALRVLSNYAQTHRLSKLDAAVGVAMSEEALIGAADAYSSIAQ